MIKQIAYALIVGCCATLFLAQTDTWVHQKIIHTISKHIYDTSGCTASFSIESINFFSPSIILSNMHVTTHHNGWCWKSEKISIESSWLQLLFYGNMGIGVALDGFEATSSVDDNGVALFSFVTSLMQKAVIPGLDIKSVIFKRGIMTIVDDLHKGTASFAFNSFSFKSGTMFKTTLVLTEGNMSINNECYVENSTVHVALTTPMCASAGVACTMNGTFQLPHLGGHDLCYINGEWNDGCARIALRSAHDLFAVDPIIITQKEIRINGYLPLSYCARAALHNVTSTLLEGSMRFSIKMERGAERKIDGLSVLEDVCINNRAICDTGKILFSDRNNEWKIKTALKQRDIYSATGIIESLQNGVHYDGEFTPCATNVTHPVEGALLYENDKVMTQIPLSVVRTLLNACTGYDVQGEGTCAIVCARTEDGIVADVELADATIRLPQTYNCIDGFKGHFSYSFMQRALACENILLSLHTGIINCSRAVAYYDDSSRLTFLHAPLLLDRCLLNIKKDLFAIISGNLLLSKKNNEHVFVEGTIFIDRAQLKENLLSSTIQKQLFSYTHSALPLPDVPVECDLLVETKSPIRVDTAFLHTDAQVHLRVQKKALLDPAIAGTISLISGTLIFPYKPLYITKGTITFSPDSLFDPAIELVARNKIKKYDVGLHIAGSLSTHHIMLDSTPPLSEEQIVALLLVGSEEDLLNAMMPALIVQNVKNLIFSSNQSSFLNSFFKPFLRSCSLNVIPSFTDQTGRGGLRGALELTVEDRWRVVIQKNFTLTEDTRFELDYLLSDDMMLRAIRDERRDFAGEIEMRWKW